VALSPCASIMNHRSSKRSGLTQCAFALSLALAGACGGRTAIDEGVLSSAGASAGTPGAGGPAECAHTTCAQIIACGTGTALVFPDGPCCPVCVSCAEQSCPVVTCPSGYELSAQLNECCPSCVPNPPDCETGRTNYLTQRSALSAQYGHGCATAHDCEVVSLPDQCELTCQFVPTVSGFDVSLLRNLLPEALQDCSNCPLSALGSQCLSTGPVTCLAGQCVFVRPQ
jgi:hypothetical protein